MSKHMAPLKRKIKQSKTQNTPFQKLHHFIVMLLVKNRLLDRTHFISR